MMQRIRVSVSYFLQIAVDLNVILSVDPQNVSIKDKLIKEDLDNTLEFLNSYEKKFNDIKTSYDCVVFKTAECWLAAIDINENVSF
jgi:hypothetical protein